MGKSGKIRTKASSEPMRWADSGEAGSVSRGPDLDGNDFDIRMSEEPDGLDAARRIVDILLKRGVCLVEANAPSELLCAAHDEAELLWQDGVFGPPLRVHDARTMLEAQLWQQTLQDDQKAVWLKKAASEGASDGDAPSVGKLPTPALQLLSKNIMDFAGGLSPLLEDRGILADTIGRPLLTCHTGERSYSLHVDNPHGGGLGDEDEQNRRPDNGMRLTAVYFINTHWDPSAEDGASCEGGLDLHLTDPARPPSGVLQAAAAPRFRIAPHADTLALFLSERMAHQVIATRSSERWYCMTSWTLNSKAMQAMLQQAASAASKAGDDDGNESGDG
eukprot:TRINITY_DN55232_c0_g1_i1.p1 TRINITY_DN55232_c0_g1~~TRINITY_DN55232_c0_g1_i1.p1  ORF type:complete len:333 (-),score=92.06 TRINITY_DN55232_c0_g1_i1:25-1023(-)